MKFGQKIAYATIVVLMVSTMVVSQSVRVVAAEYGALPASAAETTPLRSGDRAPSFTVRTVDGEFYSFDPDKLERPTVLISFRGGWCPYCNMHLSELRTVIPQIREADVDILFLSNDPPEQLYSSLKQETQEDIAGLNYTILSDSDIAAARALGTAFRIDAGVTDYLDRKDHDYSGSSIGKHNALAVPSVFVVDASGQIVYDFVNANYKIRISADDLLAAATRAR